MAGPGRREVQKRATRAALTAAARTMFAERGFDQTTVRDIADAAQVTERTFFRYFASKDDLVHGELLDLLPELSRAIVAQPSQSAPLIAVRDAVLGLAPGGPGFGLLFSGPPVFRRTRLTESLRGMLFSFEAGIADAVHTRIAPSGATKFHAEVLARAAVAAMRSSLITYHLAGGPTTVPLTTLRSLVIEAFDILTVGR